MIILRQKQFGLFGLFGSKKENLEELEEYFTSNYPPNLNTDQLKNICSEIETLNESFYKSFKNKKDLNFFALNGTLLSVEAVDLMDNKNISDYIKHNKSYKNNIPIIFYTCMAYENIIDNGYIVYNINSKKFDCTRTNPPKLDSLKNKLLYVLDFIPETLEEDFMEGEEEERDFLRWFNFWKKGYYNKAKNIINKIKL